MDDGQSAGAQGGSLGAILELVRSGAAVTRPGLVQATGLARSTVSQRVDALLGSGLLVEAGEAASTGGRPAMRLRFNREQGVVLAADLGARHGRIGVTDLTGAVLAHLDYERPIGQGPVAVLDWVVEAFDQLLAEVGRGRDAVRGIGVGLPGPVEHARGRAVSPPIMPGWDGYPVPDHLGDFGVPVLVDNDVNVMALGEYWRSWRQEVDDLLFVKVATGIGSGIISGGRVHRGAQGAAGDLGHVQVSGYEAACRCGNVGCVEAVAGGEALARELRAQGYEDVDAGTVADLVLAGDVAATRLVREAGRVLGRVLAAAVNFFNPAVIVIGGDVARAQEQLLAGVREFVYQRSLPLATRHLRIVPARLGDAAGVHGASVMVLEHILAPTAVEGLFTGRAAARSAP